MQHRIDRPITWQQLAVTAVLLMLLLAGPAGSDSELGECAAWEANCRMAEREAMPCLMTLTATVRRGCS